jgi:predicted GIY-YIG superfamily endonuclease
MARIRSIKPETPRERWRREDLALPLGHTALYWMRGDSEALLYVGITGNPIERWRRHGQKALWWPDVREIAFTTFPKEHLALAAERRAIREERPRFNIRSAAA